MKKVLLLSCKDNTFYNFRKEMIMKLHELGYEVVLSCPYGPKMDYFIERGCRFVDLEMDRRGTNIFKDFKLLLSYNKLMKTEKPDVVLTYTGKPSIYGGFICGLRKVPYIVNNAGLMETTGMFDKFMRLLYWLGYRKASCLMFQNAQEKDVIQSVVGKNVPFRRLPGSGVNLNEFVYDSYPENDNVVTINYVARIVKIKGIDELLECARRVKEKHSNVRFVLYGDYDDDIYRQRVAECEKQGIVVYGGVQMDMKPCIKSAHAVIHPSYYEGMTNVVLEHSAMGRVCIGSDVPGVRDGIDDGVTGFIFEVKNVDSMVEAIEKFLALSHEQKEEMGKRAREKMEREFDRQIVTNIYLEEIKKIQEEM